MLLIADNNEFDEKMDKIFDIDNIGSVQDVYLPRRNSDTTKTDAHGTELLNLCKSTGLRIANGRVLGDLNGNVTRYPLTKKGNPLTRHWTHEKHGTRESMYKKTVKDAEYVLET